MELNGKFRPHPRMMLLYLIYLIIIMVPLYLLGGAIIIMNILYLNEPLLIPVMVAAYFVPLTVAVIIALYWIPRYYNSISYLCTDNEIQIERGVWWKTKNAVPYGRIMNVDIIQGPLSRHFGLASVDIYTAGYTGPSGGTAGPGTRRSEASILHIQNFNEIREFLLEKLRGQPSGLGIMGGSRTGLIDEVKEIRLLLEEIKEMLKKEKGISTTAS